MLFELNLALHQFLIFARPVVNTLTLLAGEFYELLLSHIARNYTLPIKNVQEGLELIPLK